MPDDSSPLLAPHGVAALPDKRQVAASFSRAAASYDAVAELQRGVGESLLSALPEGFSPRRWVDLGCGTGYFSRALERRFGAAEGLAVDIAEGMLRHARARRRQPFHWRRRREAAVARRQLRPAVLQPGHPVVRRPPGGPGRGAAGPAAGRRAGVQQPVRRYPGRVARQLAGGGRLRPRQSLPRLRRLPATRGRQRPAAADPAPRGPAPAFPRSAQPDPRTQRRWARTTSTPGGPTA